MCGVYLNRGRVVNACMFIPTVVVLSMTEEIFVAIGQDPETSEEAENYLLAILPGVFLILQYEETVI